MKLKILLLIFFLSACQEEKSEKLSPLENIPDNAKDYFNQMYLSESNFHKVQIILLQSKKYIWLDSLKNMAQFLQSPETANEALEVYIAINKAEPFKWLNLKDLIIVESASEPDFLVFENEKSAAEYLKNHSGKIIKFKNY